MTLATLLAFSLVALIAIATPGPTVLLALANGARHGVRRAAWGMAGAAASDVVLVGAVAIGLGALLAASETAFTIVKWVGVAYLAWLGVRMLRSTGDLVLPGDDTGAGSRRALFTKSFLVAVTNPKGYLFCSALLPQFIDPAGPQALQYVVIGAVFCALDVAVMAAYAALGATSARHLRRRAVQWLERACGATLLVLAGALALVRRNT